MPLIYLVLSFLAVDLVFSAPRVNSPWDGVLTSEIRSEARRHNARSMDHDSLHRFDVLKYSPHLRFDLNQHTVSGDIEIELYADSAALNQLDFRFNHSLTIDSVWTSSASTSILATRDGVDSLQLLLTPGIGIGDTITVGIRYHGTPAPIDAWGGLFWGNSAGWQPQIAYSMGDGLSLEPPPSNYAWFPCHADPTDKVLWEAWFQAPSNRVATTGGLRIDTVHHADSTITWHYRLDQPVSTYLLFVAISDYVIQVQRESGPLIENYVYPSRQTQALTHFSNVPTVLDGFVNLFGPYPFDRFGNAMTRNGDMEHATCVSHYDGTVAANHNNDWLLFHELSHQWWGDWVTCGEWKDLWLNEGFATYCEALGMEIIYGYDSYLGYIQQDIFPDARSANDSYSIYDPDYYWGNTVYEKGAAVMHMLRMLLGDSMFFQAWREYGQEHAFGNAVTAEWQAKLEQHYGEALDWFFDAWVYGTKYPRYNVTYTVGCPNLLSIEQIQPTETLFRMPIDVRLVTVAGDTIEYSVWNDAVRLQVYTDSICSQPVRSVIIDPEDKILKSAIYQIAGGVRPSEAIPTEFRIAQIYPNPFNASAQIAFELPRPAAVAFSVFDITGRLIDRRDLGWRNAGKHTVAWNGAATASGIYLFRLENGAEVRIAKATLMK